MTDRFYDSAATPSAPYSTAATAANTLAVALAAVAAANEIIFAKNTTQETTLAANTTYSGSNTYATPASPQRLFSVSDFTAGPPVIPAFGAKLYNGNFTTTFEGNWHLCGVDLQSQYPSGASAGGGIQLGSANKPGTIIADGCTFGGLSTSASAASVPLRIGPFTTGGGNDSYYDFLNACTYFCGHTSNKIALGLGYHVIDNLILSGSVAPVTLFTGVANLMADAVVKNSDLSGLAWTNLVDLAPLSQLKMLIENCKIPAGASLSTGTCSQHNELIAINVFDGTITYPYYKINYSGSVTTTQSIYATTAPVTVGGTPQSDLMTASSTAGRGATLTQSYSVEVASGQTVTPFVELLVQGSGAAALNNNECYITAEAVTVTGATTGVKTTSHPGVLATGSANPAGSTAYTGDGYATERTHKISTAALTTTQAGSIVITVHLAKPSVGVYIGAFGAV